MPYKEEETETVLPFRGGFRRGTWNARRAFGTELPALSGTRVSAFGTTRNSPPLQGSQRGPDPLHHLIDLYR